MPELARPSSRTTEEPARGALFPIAGVGASAGGLVASRELLRELGERPGIALMVIHHLDPAHTSSIVGSLSRATPMPVQAALNGIRVQPNHVYVVPPNAGFLLIGGIVHAIPRSDEGALDLPIDRFFASLAEDCQQRAIGVLLSETGSDGGLGVRAIKEAGGITFAQDARGGPQGSASASGCVDFVLSPPAIARELLRIGQHLSLGPELRDPVQRVAPAGTGAPGRLDVHRAADRVVLAQFAPPGVVVTDELAIVQFRGELAPYLEPGSAAPNLDLLHMVRHELREPLRRLIDQARARQRRAHESGVQLGGEVPLGVIEIDVLPLPVVGVEQRFFLVLFRDVTPKSSAPAAVLPGEGEQGDATQRASERLREAQMYAQIMVDTERERARALRRSEGELREVLATALEGILMTSATGVISFTNAAADEIFGYGPQELLGQSLDVLVPERLRRQYMIERAQYLAAASPRRVGRDRALFGLRKDGSEVEIEVALRPQLRDDGLLVVCFITDVSERRASEREIVEYQRKLQQMAFDAARTEECERRRIAADLHDRIGQSLALAQLKLKASLTTDPDGRPVQDAIDLLEHSIVDTRTLIFELSPPILYDLGLKEALSWLAEDLGKRWGMRVEISDDGTPKRLGDETSALVFRAVRELLTNVLKHAQVLSAKVTLERSGDQLEIAVVDEGVGFDVQAVAPASDQGGFGLFSACEQLSRLGGTLQIESGADRGTRVRLRLPLAPEPECAAPPSSKTDQ